MAQSGSGTETGAALPGQQQTVAPSDVVLPPAPPGESPREAVSKTRAVGEVLTQLGHDADPREVAEQVRAAYGIDLSVEEAAAIKHELLERARTPPEPDRPPPQEARRRAAGGQEE